jgi:chromosomal replication initiation ATPase DnaA
MTDSPYHYKRYNKNENMNSTNITEMASLRQIARAAQREMRKATGREITFLLFSENRKEKTPEKMLQVLASALHAAHNCFSQKRRTRQLAELRFIATLLLRKHFPQITLQQIGAMFGGMDHTSIIYGYTRGTDLLATGDTSFTQKFKAAQCAVHSWLLEP